MSAGGGLGTEPRMAPERANVGAAIQTASLMDCETREKPGKQNSALARNFGDFFGPLGEGGEFWKCLGDPANGQGRCVVFSAGLRRLAGP
jgi:hypothetical protein